ncbi:TetR-like C-terminal domain-containing protein [Streptomyces sp. NPDC056387]|uniref:TetR-like C-terminal domain-containing protein n=1 Tax=Streptomyces sp. NPDC056387 TaxID=3345803 RepID=UPI0035D7FF10
MRSELRRSPVQAPADLDPEWIVQLEEMREHLGRELVALEVIYVFVACWARFYGAVAVKVFGHLDFALTDPEPLFERTVGDILAMLDAPGA